MSGDTCEFTASGNHLWTTLSNGCVACGAKRLPVDGGGATGDS